MKGIKGKKIEVGQSVIILDGPGKKDKHRTVTILTVVAIEYPFVVFSYQCPQPPRMLLSPSGPQIEASGTHQESFTMDVRRFRFQVVSDAFRMANERGSQEEKLPSWITEQ